MIVWEMLSHLSSGRNLYLYFEDKLFAEIRVTLSYDGLLYILTVDKPEIKLICDVDIVFDFIHLVLVPSHGGYIPQVA